jgi:aminoglycoside phosphotransferase (APT) family kinase protein
MEPGMSGATVARHHVTFDSPGSGSGAVSLVTKQATLLERRVLALLQAQGQPGVPFCHTADLENDTPALVCMQDVGTRHRPTSLEPIAPELVRAEANVLAHVHHANAGPSQPPDWLPRVDRQYVHAHLSEFWEPAWTRAMADIAFRREFGTSIAAVESAARRVADEIEQLADDRRQLSLLHGDLNPSNVLIAGGSPWLIDWQAACYGPFYLDLPQHFHSLALAEEYRRARAELGHNFPEVRFATGFRSAAHYIGLRSIWWTLALWQEDPMEARWVWHYLNLITL